MKTPAPSSGPRFLSCDWGTSAFRLRLVEVATRRVIAASRGDQGIAATFADWKAAGDKGGDRGSHFTRVITHHLQRVAEEAGSSVDGLPLVISGMASSSMGLRELPYRELPVATDGSDLTVERISAHDELPHPVLLISGVRTRDDVMRGEETQLIGSCAVGASLPLGTEVRRLLVFPGTHSKHVELSGAQAVSFRTYMTGEVFALLSSQSVLAHSVAGGAAPGGEDVESFAAGVRAGAADNLLHAAFRVRTRALLDHVGAAANYHYLSGLLIGAELRDIAGRNIAITLVASGPLGSAYHRALQVLGVRSPVTVHDADDCLIAGQWTVATRLGLL